MLSGRLYSSVREGGSESKYVPPVAKLAQRAEEHVKGMIVPATMFEELVVPAPLMGTISMR